jgi:hypothetical protein
VESLFEFYDRFVAELSLGIEDHPE